MAGSLRSILTRQISMERRKEREGWQEGFRRMLPPTMLSQVEEEERGQQAVHSLIEVKKRQAGGWGVLEGRRREGDGMIGRFRVDVDR